MNVLKFFTNITKVHQSKLIINKNNTLLYTNNSRLVNAFFPATCRYLHSDAPTTLEQNPKKAASKKPKQQMLDVEQYSDLPEAEEILKNLEQATERSATASTSKKLMPKLREHGKMRMLFGRKKEGKRRRTHQIYYKPTKGSKDWLKVQGRLKELGLEDYVDESLPSPLDLVEQRNEELRKVREARKKGIKINTEAEYEE